MFAGLELGAGQGRSSLQWEVMSHVFKRLPIGGSATIFKARQMCEGA